MSLITEKKKKKYEVGMIILQEKLYNKLHQLVTPHWITQNDLLALIWFFMAYSSSLIMECSCPIKQTILA